MKILILASNKKTSNISPEDWKTFNDYELILYTNYINENSNQETRNRFKDVFSRINFYRNYSTNGNLELHAVEENVDLVVSYSEIDVLRAARIRSELNISGIQEPMAMLFRNKVLMKELARKNKILVPEYAVAKNSFDLTNFINTIGFPIVVKPIYGRACIETYILENWDHVNNYLENIGTSSSISDSSWLLEEFNNGDFYCIDCLYSKGEEIISLIGKYYTTPYDYYKNGKPGALIRLKKNNPTYRLLNSFAKNLINNVFKINSTELFHIEVFKKDDQLFLCEIACRLGGLVIDKEIGAIINGDIKKLHLEQTLNIADNLTETSDTWGWYVLPNKENKVTLRNIKDLPVKSIFTNLENNMTPKKEEAYFIFCCESYEIGVEVIELLNKTFLN